MTPHDPATLFAEVEGGLTPIFRSIEIAEGEIDLAQGRHPAAADRIYHSFGMLADTPDEVRRSDLAFRAHCGEILDRVAVGADTRPGTDAEICVLCAESSLVGPLHHAGAGLYFRVFARTFPDQAEHITSAADRGHYEWMEGSSIDELEHKARAKLFRPTRRLDDDGTACKGRHHGEPVECRYHTPAQPEQGTLAV